MKLKSIKKNKDCSESNSISCNKNNTDCNKNPIKKILLLIFISFLFAFIYLFIKKKICCKLSERLNKKINDKITGILLNYKNNLNDIIKLIINSDEPKLSSSNIEVMNKISKITSQLINDDMINENIAIVLDDNYLGILNYCCCGFNLKKKIVSKILIKDFMGIFKDKLINNNYNPLYHSADVIYNLTEIIISIEKYLKKIYK